MIRAPYDALDQMGKKRETVWLGYKVHLTEMCADPARPNLIVQVHTTVAPLDGQALAPIQAALEASQLQPEEQVVDSGYIDGEQLAHGQTQGIQW